MTSEQIIFLAAAVACLATSLMTVIVVLRQSGLSFKPLWAVLSLVGVGGAAMVWSMPSQIIWFFGVAVPTASFVAAEASWAPELVRFLFPAGALISLSRVYWHRRSLTKRAATS